MLIDGAHSLPLELSGHDDRPRNTSELHELDSQLVVLETSNSSTADKPLLWRFERGKESITTLNPLHYDGTLSSGSVTVADDQHGGLLLLATAGYGENVPARLLYWPSGASIAKELSLPAEIVENDQLALVDLKDRIQLEVRGSSSIGEELRFYNLSLDQSDAFEVPEWLNQLSKSTEKDLGALIKQGEISSLSLSLMPGVNPEAPAVQLLDELQQGIEREQDLVGWVEDPSGRLWLVRAESQHVEATKRAHCCS